MSCSLPLSVCLGVSLPSRCVSLSFPSPPLSLSVVLAEDAVKAAIHDFLKKNPTLKGGQVELDVKK